MAGRIPSGTTIGGRFEIDRLAGTGGMGEVYRARDLRTGAIVAVKLIQHAHASNTLRFEREAQALAQLAHPGIVRYVAHGDEPSTFLAMEWLDGEDLAKRLPRAAPTIPEALVLVRNVAEALVSAHAKGIIHRDIKPSNIFLVSRDLANVKILDFGIAHVAHGSRGMTATGQMIGTLGYMAPEQARSGRDVSSAADVFSLGCVLFECITGRGAYPGEFALEVISKILLAEPPRAREVKKDVPHALDELVGRMMKKEPRERATLASVIADVQALLASGSTVLTSSQPDTDVDVPAVTGDERRLVAVVLADQGVGGALSQTNTTLDAGVERGIASQLGTMVAQFGGELEVLANGAPLITMAALGAATDLATRAARCALSVQRVLGGARVAVAMGRGDPTRAAIVGEVAARAEQLLAMAEDNGVRIDAITAGLLGSGFEVSGDSNALLLVREHARDGARKLLGKVTPCVGRERELAMLQALAAECLDEPIATAVLVTAPAGAGKSRVRYELLRMLAERPAPPEVWIARGDPMSSGSPFGMLAQMLRGAAGLVEGEHVSVRRQKLLARLGRNLAADDALRVGEFLGELVGAHFLDEGRPTLRTARQDAAQMGDQLRRAWEELLAAETAAGPLVIVLEDLHWGDLPSIRFVDAVLRTQRQRPLLVVSLARPEVYETFPGLFRDRRVTEIRLADLTPSASRRLILDALGDDIDRAKVDALIERAHGNAFYLEELIRSVAEGRSGGDDALPETVLAMAQARLERLEPGARRLLRAASVFGPRFWVSGVGALVANARHAEVKATLDDLVQREVVNSHATSHFKSDPEYSFRHILVRDAAYQMLTDRDRRVAHKLAAEWLEASGERDAIILAEHLDRSGERQGAVVWYLWAAEQALEGNDLAGVIARAERGIECGARGPVLGELQLLQAEACGWAGQGERQADLSRAALGSLTRASTAWCRAAAELVVASGTTGDHEQLRATAHELASVPVDDAPNSVIGLGHAWAVARTVVELLGGGHPDVAATLIGWLDGASARADEADAPTLRTMLVWLRAAIALYAGDPKPILASGADVARAFESAGHVRYTAIVALHVAIANAAVRDAEAGLRWCDRAAELARRMGLRAYEARVTAWRALHLARSGRLDEAMSSAEAALAGSGGDRVAEGDARVSLAEVLVEKGERDLANVEARVVWDDAAFSVEARARAGLLLVRTLGAGRAADSAKIEADAQALLARARPLG